MNKLTTHHKRSLSTKARKATTKRKNTAKAAKTRGRRIFGLKLHHAGGLAVFLLGVVYAAFLILSQPATPGNAAVCTPDAKMVNPCRPWLSAAVGGYNTGGKTQYQFFNTRLNNANALTTTSLNPTLTYKMDGPHVYHSPGQNLFNSNAKEVLADDSLYGHPSKPILINWKPGGSSWGATARGDNDASIRAAADQVKALGSRKIMLALWHEPENDNVSAAGLNITGNCKTPSGTNGSAEDYRNMWRRTYDIFREKGVTNVIWVWNPMGYVASGDGGWSCIENALYPGDDIVDWIMWDPYSQSGGAGSFYDSVNRFYQWLIRNDGNNSYGLKHSYTSKPWGVAEFGSNTPQADVIAYYQDGVKTIGKSWAENKLDKIKLYAVFDTASNGGVNGGLRVGYNNQGNIDVKEQEAFNAFAKNILTFNDQPAPTPPPAPTKDTVPPTITLDSPADGTTVKGDITIKATASDNVKVTAVTLRVDDKFVETDKTAPYSFTLNTKKYKNGKHTIVVRAWDPTDNMGQSKVITLNFQNGTSAPKGTATPVQPAVTTVTTTTATTAAPVKVTGTLLVSPTTPGNSIQVWVDGKLQPNNVVDVAWLTNGNHEIKIVENGIESMQLVSVKNPPIIAAVNTVRANAVAYGSAAALLILALVLWVSRPYIFGLTSRRERNLVKKQRRG